MPPTRRLIQPFPQSRRRITRRRTRRSTWMELVSLNSITSPNPSTRQHSRSNNDENFRIVPNDHHCHQIFTKELSHATSTDDVAVVHSPTCNRQMDFGNNGTHHHENNCGLLSTAALDENVESTSANEIQDSEGRDDNMFYEASSDPIDNELQSDEDSFEGFLGQREFVLCSSSIMAFILVCGSVRFSVRQYNIVRSIVKYAKDDTELPSYSTIQRKLFPHFLKNCFPRSETKFFAGSNVVRRRYVKPPTASNSSNLPPIGNQCKRICTRVVNPTEWAILDVGSLPYFQSIFGVTASTEGVQSQHEFSIEDSFIVQHRDSILNSCKYLYVEDDYGFVAATTGDKISIRLPGLPRKLSLDELQTNEFDVTQLNNVFTIQADVVVSWCVGSAGKPTPSCLEALDTCDGLIRRVINGFATCKMPESTDTCHVQDNHGTGGQRFFTDQVRDADVQGGDICTIVAKDKCSNPSILFIIVSRFQKPYEGSSSQFIIWLRNTGYNGRDSSYVVFDIQLMKGAPRLNCDQSRSQIRSQERKRSNHGKLKDGRPYVVYRALLYCDDFKDTGSQYSQSSSGGVYLLPVGLSSKARSSRTAVHIISLTPPGVSTNEILLHIIPDIVRGTTGVEGMLPSGEKVLIFLDIVGYIADYPAATEPLDVLGHTSDAPCTHCNFRKFKQGKSSTVGYTNKIHSCHTPSLRCGERHNALRECGISDRLANVLGMKPSALVTDNNCPLLALQTALYEARSGIPLSNENIPVVPGMFDAFRSSLIAPDHLLSGIARNIINLCFLLVRPQARDVDILICSYLRTNGLIKQRCIYNESKRQLHSMSLSGIFCVLQAAYPAFNAFVDEINTVGTEGIRLLKQFKELVALTYWKPSKDVDGEQTYNMISKGGGREYQGLLQRMAEQYVASVDKFCELYPEKGTVLDKPNLHRLLEFYHHTLPAFGHISLVQELVFETAHQPLKRCIAQSNGKTTQASTVEHALGNDWQARLALLFSKLSTDGIQKENEVLRGLRNLLFGRDYEDHSSSENEETINIVNSKIRGLFVSPLAHMLRVNGNVNSGLAGAESQWMLAGNSMINRARYQQQCEWDVFQVVERTRKLFQTVTGNFKTSEEMKVEWKAKRISPSGIAGPGITYGHDILECGSVVQAIVRIEHQRDFILRPGGNENCIMALFVTIAFLQGSSEGNWAIVLRCKQIQDDLIRTPRTVSDRDVQVLLLSTNVRRVGVYHKCDLGGLCHINRTERTVEHGERVITGGTFQIQKRSQGYPPRLA